MTAPSPTWPVSPVSAGGAFVADAGDRNLSNDGDKTAV
jgi:hypothetical protein